MADNTENIGGVSVSITGDYSQLAGDFDAAVALAVSKGATLAEAIKSAMAVPDTAPLTQAFGVVGDSAVTAAGQLKLFDEAAHVNYSDAAGQLNLFATELEAMGPSAAQAATGIMQIPVALGEAGEKAHETEGIIKEFGEKVSEILEHPVQQFRALVEAIGPVGIAMGTLGAIVYELGKNITELVLEEGQAARNTENFAEKLGLSFEEAKKLSEMAQVVSVDIGSLTRVSTLLAQALEDPDGSPKARKTADALREMGIAAETGGQAMLGLLQHLAGISDATERLAEAARIIPARTVANLQPLLANFDELSKAIEALGGQLDESMVKGLLEANKQSKLLGIAWDHMKEAMAATFAPTVTDGLKLLTQLMTGAPSGTLEEQIKRVTAEINSLTASALAGTVAVSGMMGGGFTALGAGGDPAQLEALQKQLDDLRFRRIKEQMPPETGTPLAPIAPDLSAATYAAYAQLGVTNYSSLKQGTTDESGLTTKFSDLQAFDSLATSLTGPRLAQAADNLEAKLQAAFHAGAITADEFHDAVDRVEQKLNEARDSGQLYGETIAKAFQVPTGFTGLDGAVTTLSSKFEIAQAHLQRFTQLNQALTTGLDGTGLALLKATTGIEDFDVGISKAASEAGALGGLMLSTSQEMPKFYAPLIKAEKEWAAAEISDGQAVLKAMHIRQSESLEETLANNKIIQESDRYSAQVKLESQHKTNVALLADAQFYRKEQEENLRTEIALAAERGQDATAYIIALTRMQYETKALADRSNELGKVYVDVRLAFNNAFADLSKGLADAIVNSKDLGDVFINVGKKIATSILDTIIQGALKPLQDELNKTGGLFDTLGKQISGGLGKVLGRGASIPKLPGGASVPGSGSGEVASEGNALPGGSPGDFGGEAGAADAVPGGSSGGSSGGGALGSLGGVVPIVGAVSAAVGAVSSVIANFQFSHMNKLLGEIEVTTRKMEAAIGGNGSESIFGYTKLTWQATQVMIGELGDLHMDAVAVLGKFDDLMNMGGGGNANGGTGGTGGGLSSTQVLDLVVGLQSGTLQRMTLPVANPLYPGAQPSLDTSAANSALDQLSVKATAAGTTLADFGTATAAAQTAALDGAKITASLSKAQQNQLGLVNESMAASLNEAHTLLEAGQLNAQQLFALARESATLGAAETATELAQRQVINAMAAAQANWNGGKPQVAGTPGAVAQALSPETEALQVAVAAIVRAAPIYQSAAEKQSAAADNQLSAALNQIQATGRLSQYASVVTKNGVTTYTLDAPIIRPMPSMSIDTSFSTPGNPPLATLPTNPWTGGNGSYSPIGGNVAVTVNALNPSSRGVVDGFITGLRQIGMKV